MSQANDLLLSRIDDRGDAGHSAYLTPMGWVTRPPRLGWMAWPALMRLALWGVLCGFAGAALALEINLASEAELDSVRGMGPAMSRAILAERQAKPFSGWADLMQRVKGIRSASAERFAVVTASARTLPALIKGNP